MKLLVPIGHIAVLVMACFVWLSPAGAHHILGRPAYSLNENSNTPPSMNGEALIGDYSVTYMMFPAFPQPGKPGRISFYATRIDDGAPFTGDVTFKVRAFSWFSWLGVTDEPETLGVQRPDEAVFRQSFMFHKAGDYIVTVEFEAGGEPYIVDFPVHIGTPAPVGPVAILVIVALLALLAVAVVQRRRAATGKLRAARDAARADRG